MLRDSVVVVVVVVVVRTRPRAIPLAMIAIRKILHGFPFLSRDAYGAPLGGPLGRRSSATIHYITYTTHTTYNTVLYHVFFPFCTHGTKKKKGKGRNYLLHLYLRYFKTLHVAIK